MKKLKKLFTQEKAELQCFAVSLLLALITNFISFKIVFSDWVVNAMNMSGQPAYWAVVLGLISIVLFAVSTVAVLVFGTTIISTVCGIIYRRLL